MKKQPKELESVTQEEIDRVDALRSRVGRDCGSNSCRYAKARTGMRTNGHCTCDVCGLCGIDTANGRKHSARCALA